MRSLGLIGLTILCAGFDALALDGGDALRIPVTARVVSLGAGGALADGSEAVFYNPAGAAARGGTGVSLTHTQLYEDTRLDAVSLTQAAGTSGQLGLSVLALTQEPIQGRDELGRAAGSFTAMDRVVGLTWARAFEGRSGTGARFGVTAKHIEQRIADAVATGFAGDLGAQLTGLGGIRGLSLGLSARNAGPSMRFVSERYPLPLTVSFAAGYEFPRGLAFQAGVSHRPYANMTELNAGLELWLLQSFALRTGSSNRMGGGRAALAQGPLASLAAGLGWKFPGGSRLDYAFTPGVPELGNSHRLTLELRFTGESRPAWDSRRPARKASPPVKRVTWDNYWRRGLEDSSDSRKP